MGVDATRRLALLVLVALLAPRMTGQAVVVGHEALSPGLVVRVKGELTGPDEFLASSLEVREADDEEELVAVPRALDVGRERFELLGQPVFVSGRTEWKGTSLAELGSAQVKVEGHWRGEARFSAREIEVRNGVGRDRIEGRIDALRREGGRLHLRIMRFEVIVPADVAVESELPLDAWERLPVRVTGASRAAGDDDDELSRGTSFGGQWSLGVRIETKLEHEGEYDLDDGAREDVRGFQGAVRGEVLWEPDEDIWFVFGFRERYTAEHDEAGPSIRGREGTLTEAHVGLSDPFGLGVDVIVGRQDFDDPREWLYDENLDAVRFVWRGEGVHAELSASTVLADGGPANRETDNFVLYVSNGDEDRHLAAWVMDRRRHGGGVVDKPIFFGLRALGEWLPQNDAWLELATRSGYGRVDYRGWAADVGTTWAPPAAAPLRFTVGVAHGSGDDDTTDDVDRSFRQTGLQDNTGRFGGVTSFRYYGELVDPELSNLTVLTAGVGARLGAKHSIDLVWHHYRQDVAETRQRSDLDARPNGLRRELGQELDLIFGSRAPEGWQTEIVLSRFWPGAAYREDDGAWFGKLQVRRGF